MSSDSKRREAGLLATAMVPIKMLYVHDVVGDEVSVPGDDTG